MSTPTSAPSALWDARATIEPGRLVAGRYLLIAPVGRGGSGSVWRAHDELLDRDVAIKRLHGGRALDEARARQVRDRAHREGRVAARLHHPRLAAIFDMTELDGEVCLVMEYVAAPSLADLLEREGPLPPPRVAAIGAEIAEGLAAMHGRGIVHRDVKPANIMIGVGDVVTVTDFGIAVVDADPGAGDHLVAGTPHYMAPELARGGVATAAADVFSLGATLYAALEGTPPAGDGGNALEVLARVATGVVQPARHAGDLTPVLRALLDHDPARRPTAAQAARLLSGESASAPGVDTLVSEGATDRTGPIALPPATRAVTPVTARSARRKRSDRLRPARRVVAAGAGLVGVLGVAGVVVAANTADPVPLAAGPDAAGAALPAPLPVPVAAPPVIPVDPTPSTTARTTTTRQTAVEDVDEVAATSSARRSRGQDSARAAAAWERWWEQYRAAAGRGGSGDGPGHGNGNGNGNGRGNGHGHGRGR
ncbi:hypothetical protein GCM10023200_41150 [Actinomycetospora chlora]|uniref:non-specific serine/threonine protein kinase n=1 Tax=Actinomycetospora chlora TaxID=663608 RepID=A0ABP9BXG6_9PSEU